MKPQKMSLEEAVQKVMEIAGRQTVSFSAHDITRLIRRLVETKSVTLTGGDIVEHSDVRNIVHRLFRQDIPANYIRTQETTGNIVYLLHTPANGLGEDFLKSSKSIIAAFENQTPVITFKKQKATKKAPLKLIAPVTLIGNKSTPIALPAPIPTPIATPILMASNTTPANPTGASVPQTDIVQEVRLIYSDVQHDNNKVWLGVLKKNGDVYTEWGRVGKAMQTKTYPNAGQRKLEAKEREKLNKGYTRAQVIAAVQSTSLGAHVQNHNLLDLAVKQIAKGEPLLTRVITQLVNANIHKITSQSQITYNNTTGLFQTPLGVVTIGAIQEAYQLLQGIETALLAGDLTVQSNMARISQYLRLIPQDFGMRLNVNKMFPDDTAIQKQRDLLDTLESSYRMVTAPKKAEADDGTKAPEESLFEVSIKMADAKETERVRKLYHKTKQSMHHYVAKMDVKAVYEIYMPTQRKAFDAHGAKMTNVWELWHGTKMCNVLNILRTGLSVAAPNAAPKAGQLFGPGCYFSDISSKSLNYATDYWHGGGRGKDPNFFMFLGQVAMGNFMVPPGQRNSPPPKGYDSYFAKPGKSGIQNNEMIVFKESQFLLTRLVEFSENGK